jgi:hypothetical protein
VSGTIILENEKASFEEPSFKIMVPDTFSFQ